MCVSVCGSVAIAISYIAGPLRSFKTRYFIKFFHLHPKNTELLANLGLFHYLYIQLSFTFSIILLIIIIMCIICFFRHVDTCKEHHCNSIHG